MNAAEPTKKLGSSFLKINFFKKFFQKTIVVIRKRGKNRKRSLNLRINLDSTSEEWQEDSNLTKFWGLVTISFQKILIIPNLLQPLYSFITTHLQNGISKSTTLFARFNCKKKYLHATLIIQCLRSAVHKASFELDLVR